DGLPPRQRLGESFELQEPERGVQLTHLAVDSGGRDGDLVDETKILQVIDSLLRLGVRRDDCAALEGVEHLRRVKAEDGEIAIVEDASTRRADAERVRRVV